MPKQRFNDEFTSSLHELQKPGPKNAFEKIKWIECEEVVAVFHEDTKALG